MIPITDEQAKAAQEVAKTAGKALDLISGAAEHIATAFGDVPANLVGVAGGDWLSAVRVRNLAKLKTNTDKLLEGIAKERRTEPAPSIVIPLLEAAGEETRDILQGLWAALLANCMTDGGIRVRGRYIGIIRQLDPADAVVLRAVAGAYHSPQTTFSLGQLADKVATQDIGQNECQIALQTLISLGLLASMPSVPTDRTMPVPQPSPLGRGLLAACQVE
jgi:hypothetical protein